MFLVFLTSFNNCLKLLHWWQRQLQCHNWGHQGTRNSSYLTAEVIQPIKRKKYQAGTQQKPAFRDKSCQKLKICQCFSKNYSCHLHSECLLWSFQRHINQTSESTSTLKMTTAVFAQMLDNSISLKAELVQRTLAAKTYGQDWDINWYAQKFRSEKTENRMWKHQIWIAAVCDTSPLWK